MQFLESVLVYLCPFLADVLIGFGLAALLEFSRLSPDSKYILVISAAVLLALGIASLLRPCQNTVVPAWVAICNTTYSLILSLALSLNLLSQLCPPSGKQLCIIPVYSLLCIPRMHPSGHAQAVLAWASGLMVCAFLALPTSRAVRPSGLDDVTSGWTLFVSLLAGGWLQTFADPIHAMHMAYLHDTLRARLWRGLAVVGKGLLLVLLGTSKSTSLYHFMYERASAVPKEIFLAYGIVLLFGCMQTASVWIEQLKQILGSQAKRRLVVRIQHIIYALIVAAAWAYPLQLHELRVMILLALLAINVFSLFTKKK